jgi:hypothetical protein
VEGVRQAQERLVPARCRLRAVLPQEQLQLRALAAAGDKEAPGPGDWPNMAGPGAAGVEMVSVPRLATAEVQCMERAAVRAAAEFRQEQLFKPGRPGENVILM